MHFDWSSLLLFASLLNLVFTAVLALFSGKFRANRKARVWFLVLNLSIGIILAEDIIRNSQLFEQAPYFLFVSTPFLFLLQPALLFYQRALNGKSHRYWPHLILPLLNSLLMMPTILMAPIDKLSMLNQEGINDPVWIVAFYFLYFSFYQVLIFRGHRSQSKALENEYSKNSLEWQRLSSKAVAFSGLALFAIPVILIIQYFSLSPETEVLTIKVATVTFSMISHVLLFSIVLSTENKKVPKSIEKREVESDELAQKKQALLDFVKSSKPHLNNDLTLNRLAESIGWSRSELSAVINRGFQLNFYDFINSQRLAALSEKIENQEDLTYSLDHLVEACGFSNYVSFYRYVKRTRGTSPSAFVKAVRSQK